MSAPLEQGETYQYRHTVTDATGTLVNAGSVSVTVTLPDGTTTTPTVVNTSTGIYDFDYTTSQVGRHTLLGTASGGALGTATEKFDDTFHVEAPGRLLVGFDEARTALRGTSTITTLADREQLRWLIVAASDGVERALGRTICRRSGIVEYFEGGGHLLRFPRPPLRYPDGFITVTSVVEDGDTLVEGTDFVLQRRNWSLLRGTLKNQRYWNAGEIVVTYSAGCNAVPPSLRTLVLNEVQEKWQQSQQASHPLLDEGNIEAFTGQLALTMATNIDRDVLSSFRSRGVA